MRRRLIGIVVILLLSAGLSFWLISLATPSTEAARLRNALLADVGDSRDFDWRPGNAPESYKEETMHATAQFKGIHQRLFSRFENKESEFPRIIRIAEHLLQVEKRKSVGILADTSTAYREIIRQGAGYCADFTQVMNAMARAENIPVREWGMAFDDFGGSGHAFSEIYDTQLNKWIFIDVFNSLYVLDKANKQPLSVLEFRERLQNNQNALEIVPIVKSRFGFKDPEQALQYFERGKDQFYLWWGNNIYSYEDHPVVKLAAPVSRHLEQLAAIAVGVHPKIRIIGTKENANMVKDLFNLKMMLIAILASAIVLGYLLVMQILYLWRSRKKITILRPASFS